jgi:uncharacterized protein with NRDE domain
MCLISVAWRCSDDYPFVFVGNRDEYHARASAPAAWWEDAPDVLGGRDLVAGGSWLGISRAGHFAVVTNRPDLPAPDQHALSRGALVRSRLQPQTDIAELDRQLAKDSRRYGGFSLLSGAIGSMEPTALTCYSGGNGAAELSALAVQPGVFGLSNTAIDDPWPKLEWLNAELLRMMHAGQGGDCTEFFKLLLRADPVPDADIDWVSARPFIVGEEYGTRCATVITVNNQGQCRFIERRFGAGGAPNGETDESFAISVG